MKKRKFIKISTFSLIFTLGVFSYSCKDKVNSSDEIEIQNEVDEDDNLEEIDTVNVSSNDFSMLNEAGEKFNTESLRGKVVFINFWATWCPPCIKEMPSIEQLKKSYDGNDDIVFLLVDVDGKMEKSKAFMQKNNFDLQVSILDSNIPSTLLGNAIPTTIILDKNGQIAGKLEGAYDYSNPEMKKALDQLLTQS